MKDLIERQAAIDALAKHEKSNGHNYTLFVDIVSECAEIIRDLPSAHPERLTDDDFETIRIHLNAYKEKLCNQQRWKEAEEYQRIIDRFMAFASAQSERTCEYWDNESKFCALCRPSAQPVDKDTNVPVKDCISRRAAIDALCNDYCGGHQDCKYYPKCENLKSIQKLPSAQTEIIRCTECKHYREYDSEYVENAVVVQCMADRYPISETIPDGWFCAGAERKDDE